MIKVDCFGTELVVDILMDKNQMAILNLSPLEDYIWAKIFYELGWNVPDPSNIAKSCFAYSMDKKERSFVLFLEYKEDCLRHVYSQLQSKMKLRLDYNPNEFRWDLPYVRGTYDYHYFRLLETPASMYVDVNHYRGWENQAWFEQLSEINDNKTKEQSFKEEKEKLKQFFLELALNKLDIDLSKYTYLDNANTLVWTTCTQ
jgi:hypothetical protein